MKRMNMPLIMGTLIIVLLLAVILFPEAFTSKSPYNMQHLIFSREGGSLEVEVAPHPPSAQFILGSDDMGRDIYSFIIYGTGLTILLGVLTAIGRFLIAVPMAISAGFGNGTSKTTIRQFNILFSAIPALLISVIILKLDYLAGLDKRASILAFVTVLSLVGWPKLGALLMERVDFINKQPFIRSEVAIGKGRIKIAVENVFPHLAPEMVVLFFMEIARALSMIMQLGIFSVFVGFLKIIKDTEGGVSFYDISFEPEWAGMLSTAKNFLSTAPWAVIFPAIAFFISVLGFNLFGEGLRNILQRKDSLFIPRVRKLLSFDIKYIWSSFSRKGKAFSVIFVVSIIFSLSFFILAGNGKKLDITDVSLPEAHTAVIGTDEAYAAARLISTKMEELELTPMDSESFIHTYTIPTVSLILEQKFVLGNQDKYSAGTDYTILDSPDGSFSGGIYDATRMDLFSMEDFSMMEDYFVMIDKAYYNDAAISYFMNKIEGSVSVRGFILVARSGEMHPNIYCDRIAPTTRVMISGETAKDIKDMEKPEINISISAKTLGETGLNVIGFCKGMDELLNEEVIMIGLPFNYSDDGEKQILGFGIRLMEEICKKDKNRRSLMFVFMDGTDYSKLSGIHALEADYPYSASKTKVFINMLDLNQAGFDNLIFSNLQAPFTRQYAWSLGRQLKSNLEQAGIGITEAKSIFFGDQYYFTDDPTYNTMFMDRGIATIIIAADDEGNGKNSIEHLGRILVDTINDNIY
ncbi:MAG: ABC transporter permease [Clostridia bacterium]|nr:ABC transporter permease [Clostridia bacterium]